MDIERVTEWLWCLRTPVVQDRRRAGPHGRQRRGPVEDDGVLVAGDAIASFEGAPIVGVFNVDRAEERQPGRSSGRFLASSPSSRPVAWPTSIT